MPEQRKKRQIAPRLIDRTTQTGFARRQGGGSLPPVVKDWVRLMAEREGKSASFWMEEQVLHHIYPAHLRRRVRYVKPKNRRSA